LPFVIKTSASEKYQEYIFSAKIHDYLVRFSQNNVRKRKKHCNFIKRRDFFHKNFLKNSQTDERKTPRRRETVRAHRLA